MMSRPAQAAGHRAARSRRTWLHVDEAFAAQMAERARLLSGRRGDVLAVTDGAGPAMDELLQGVLDWLGRMARLRRRPDRCGGPMA